MHDTRIILFSSYEPCFFTAGDIFENPFAEMLFQSFHNLFQSGDILVYIRETSLAHLIEKKRINYAHEKNNYERYYNNSWKEIEKKGLFISKKEYKTSAHLEVSFAGSIRTDKLIDVSNVTEKGIDFTFHNNVNEYLIEVLLNRNGKAITRALFNSVMIKKKCSENYITNFNLLLSEKYIELKIKNHPATIATSLSIYMPYFDKLSSTFPYHDIKLWKEIYHIIGAFYYIINCVPDEIVEIRNLQSFRFFVGNIRFLINFLYKNRKFDYNLLLKDIRLKAPFYFPKINSIVKNIDDFKKRVDEINSFSNKMRGFSDE